MTISTLQSSNTTLGSLCACILCRLPPQALETFVQLFVVQRENPVYVTLSFLGTKNAIFEYTNFCSLGKHISNSIILCQQFFIFCVIYQSLDVINCLQEAVHLKALNAFLNNMKFFYIILVETTHYICTLSCRLDEFLQKSFLWWVKNRRSCSGGNCQLPFYLFADSVMYSTVATNWQMQPPFVPQFSSHWSAGN